MPTRRCRRVKSTHREVGKRPVAGVRIRPVAEPLGRSARGYFAYDDSSVKETRMSAPMNTILKALASALLAGLTSASVSLAASDDARGGSADVTEKRILEGASSGRDWLVTGGNFGQTHFSPLKTINQQNIKQLGLAWWLDIDSPMGLAVEPLEVDGTIYLSASRDRVFAIEATSGHLRWSFDPHVSLSQGSYYTLTNKGVSGNGTVGYSLGHRRLPPDRPGCGERQAYLGFPGVFSKGPTSDGNRRRTTCGRRPRLHRLRIGRSP